MTQASTNNRLHKGERLFSKGRLVEAREIFESLVREDASSKEALNNLGVIAHQYGDMEKAFHYFMKALHIDPHYQEAIDNLYDLKGELERNPFPAQENRIRLTSGARTAINTASSSVHHLDRNAQLITNRKEYVVNYCKSKAVLHIGCVGSGSVEERIRDGSHLHRRLSRVARSLIGLDINSEGIAAMQRAGLYNCLVRDIERDGIDLDLIEDIDVILVPEVLEHLSNPGRFLDHLKKLNYSGDILISVPNALSYRTYIYTRNLGIEFVHPDHHFYFSPTTLRTFFKKHGFSTISQVFYYWPSSDTFGKEFESVLKSHPYLAEGIITIVKDCRHTERIEDSFEKPLSHAGVHRRRSTEGPLQKAVRNQKSSIPYKLYYSPGIRHHGENARHLLNLDHYLPSLHYMDPVWFFGLYFDQDYLQVSAHSGRKIINWRGADALRLVNNSEWLKIIQRTEAIHVCQARHQKELLSRYGIRAVVRPMMNTPFRDITLSDFPVRETSLLVYWRNGDDRYIQAELFFDIASRCPDITFHVVGEEDPGRFQQPGMENIRYHGFIPEDRLDRLMDQCKGTIRPWIWDGNPNIQAKMILKGRYAAHSCSFEKVTRCKSADDYVDWIEWLKGVEVPNLEARDWWLRHLNNFDFLEPDFDPENQSSGEEI